jgi:hypothetical protein
MSPLIIVTAGHGPHNVGGYDGHHQRGAHTSTLYLKLFNI